MVERIGETSEYAKWMQRLQARCDKGNLPYPPELCRWLEKLKEARDGRQKD